MSEIAEFTRHLGHYLPPPDVDLVEREGQEEMFAVLSVGGFLGIGDKRIAVPVSELDVGQDGQIVMADASEDQLKQMPEYDE